MYLPIPLRLDDSLLPQDLTIVSFCSESSKDAPIHRQNVHISKRRGWWFLVIPRIMDVYRCLRVLVASESYHIGPSQGVQFQDLKYLIRRNEMFFFFL